MSKIVQMTALLVAFFAFCVTVTVGFISGVQPVTVLIRGVIALGIFGMIGALLFQVVAKNIMIDIQRNQIEEIEQSNQNNAQMQSESAETPR